MNKMYYIYSALTCILLCVNNITSSTHDKKPWTFMIYMAADNDLAIFQEKNIKQMAKIGSNDNVNIIVNVNTSDAKNKQIVSRTLYIKKNEAVELYKELNSFEAYTTDKNLIKFCTSTIETFPSEYIALIFWNHGTGTIDPVPSNQFYKTNIFSFNNQKTNIIDYFSNTLKSSFLYLKQKTNIHSMRGVCFNDSTNTYLCEQKLTNAISTIIKTSLNNKKIDIIGFDACYMSMIEIATSLQNYAHYMVASEDIEFGPGWNYHKTLLPFTKTSFTPEVMAKYIVYAYENTYKNTEEYTLSAIKLENINTLLLLLKKIITLLQTEFNKNNKEMQLILEQSRNKKHCTHFNEPDFIDLHNFLCNIKSNISKRNIKISKTIISNLYEQLKITIHTLEKTVIQKCSGSKHQHAKGLSIYFPERYIDKSYFTTKFACSTLWTQLLDQYIKQKNL